LRLLGGLGLVGGLRVLGSLGGIGGLGSATGGEAVHGLVEGGHSGVHRGLILLRQRGIIHHSLGIGQSGAEGSHRLGGVAGEVDALSLADEVFQDGLVRLEALGQNGIEQGLGGGLHVLLHSVAIRVHVLGLGQGVHQLLPVVGHVLVGVGHHAVGLGDQLLQQGLVAL